MDHLTQGRHSSGRAFGDYTSLDGFVGVDLEASRVMDIVALPGSVTLYLDAALTAEHPDFQKPRQGTDFDFRSARVMFDHVTDLTWAAQRRPGQLGFYGDLDHGPVQNFQFGNGLFELTGEFGVITVRGFDCRLRLLEDSAARNRGTHREPDTDARHSG